MKTPLLLSSLLLLLPRPAYTSHSPPQSPIMTDRTSSPDTSPLLLSDILGQSHAINIFTSLVRDVDSLVARLDSRAPEANLTILAPLNSAVQALPRKPWEDPPAAAGEGGVSASYEGAAGQERAAENLARFVEAHAVPRSPWGERERAVTLAGGREVWWESGKEGKMVIQPDGIEVVRIANKAANGELWIIKGVINYAS